MLHRLVWRLRHPASPGPFAQPAPLDGPNLAFDMSGASGQIHGDVSSGLWDSALSADMAPVFTAKQPSPLACDYTLSLPWSSGR